MVWKVGYNLRRGGHLPDASTSHLNLEFMLAP